MPKKREQTMERQVAGGGRQARTTCAAASLDKLDPACVAHVLSFLSLKDLASVAQASRWVRNLRCASKQHRVPGERCAERSGSP